MKRKNILLTGSVVAVDGGSVGDIVRVKYPSSGKIVSAKIVKNGLVELI